MSGHVFISYRHDSADAEYVQRLAAMLTNAGVSVWFDRELVSGERWDRVVQQQIETCAAFVIVMTPGSNESDWVARELAEAERLRKPILPLLLAGAIFFRLGNFQYEDVRSGELPDRVFVQRLRALAPPIPPAAPTAPALAPLPAATAPWPLARQAPDPAAGYPQNPAPSGQAGLPWMAPEPPLSPSPGARRRRFAIIGSAAMVVLITAVAVILTVNASPGGSPSVSANGPTNGPTNGLLTNSPTVSAGASQTTTGLGPGPTYTACMVTDQGGLDDRSFNAAAWQGMLAARDDSGTNVVVRNIVSRAERDYEPNLTSFVNQGCDLIMAVGGLMSDATKNVAMAHPSQQFAIVDANPKVTNVYPMQFNISEAAFVAGYLAAGYSKTGKVATYGGLKIPPVTAYMDGFVDGVAYYNQVKGAHVQSLGWDKAAQTGLFTNNFVSPSAGASMTNNLLAQGADIIMPIAGGTGLATAQAAAAGQLAAIWVDTDGCTSTDYCPGVLTSAMKNIATVVQATVLRGAKGQSLAKPGIIGTLASGGVSLALFHDFDAKIGQSLKSEVLQITADIKAGQIKVASPNAPSNA